MSICRDCFKKGNHTNHDFNMFLSQAGGACDCGDTSVMKAEGFCSDHGINNRVNRDPVPNNLLAVAEAIMPKLLFRLLQHFREHSDALIQPHAVTSYSCEAFANMLIDLNNMGEIMRKVMTRTLINADVYSYFMEIPCQDTRNGRFLKANREKYEDAVNRFPNPEPPDEYRDLPALGNKLVHTTLLEEFIFWTFKFEFPQTLVCFLLNMLPDQDYKVSGGSDTEISVYGNNQFNILAGAPYTHICHALQSHSIGAGNVPRSGHAQQSGRPHERATLLQRESCT